MRGVKFHLQVFLLEVGLQIRILAERPTKGCAFCGDPTGFHILGGNEFRQREFFADATNSRALRRGSLALASELNGPQGIPYRYFFSK